MPSAAEPPTDPAASAEPAAPAPAYSLARKIFLIGFIIVVMLIPLSLLGILVSDRESRNNAVVAEIGESWGQIQRLTGPVLVVPYQAIQTVQRGDRTVEERVVRQAAFLPDDVDIKVVLEPGVRRRGLYDVTVYTATVDVTGRFSPPDLARLGIADGNALWEDAVLQVGVADTRAIKDGAAFRWNGLDLALRSGPRYAVAFDYGIHAPAPGRLEGTVPFALHLVLAGSQAFNVVPVGKETKLEMRSAWPHPSFGGGFLPLSSSITPAGFTASWSVPDLARNFPQSWTSGGPEMGAARESYALDRTAFGVRLVRPVDLYTQVYRAVTYGVLFVVFTFMAFFLFEVSTRARVHIVQYLFIGAALCLFFALLLSLAEHIGLLPAYLLAAGAVAGTITLYTVAVLGSWVRAAIIFGVLAMLYAFLFVLLQVEDYALLLGSLALFAALAATMYLTRHVDWYAGGAVLPPPRRKAEVAPP